MIAASLAAGVALGVGSSLAPGPCGLAVLTATRHRQRRRALAIGVGAGLGDAACATLACAGVGTWLAGQAGSATMARVAGAAALLVCGLRARRAAGQPAPARSARSRVPRLLVIDLNSRKVVHCTYVAHGHNSGLEYANQFSNKRRAIRAVLGSIKHLAAIWVGMVIH